MSTYTPIEASQRAGISLSGPVLRMTGPAPWTPKTIPLKYVLTRTELADRLYTKVAPA